MICIYASQNNSSGFPTTDKSCVEYTKKALERIGIQKEKIFFVDRVSNLNHFMGLEPRSLIVLPGGFAPALFEELHESKERIDSFVRGGGKILGICSGSIALAEEYIDNQNLLRQTVVNYSTATFSSSGFTNTREFKGPLEIVPLTALFPVLRDIKGAPIRGYQSTDITLEDGTTVKMAFADGISFRAPLDWLGKTLATFPGKPAGSNIAAWEESIGLGKVIGISFHPELPIPGNEEQAPEGIEFFKKTMESLGMLEELLAPANEKP